MHEAEFKTSDKVVLRHIILNVVGIIFLVFCGTYFFIIAEHSWVIAIIAFFLLSSLYYSVVKISRFVRAKGRTLIEVLPDELLVCGRKIEFKNMTDLKRDQLSMVLVHKSDEGNESKTVLPLAYLDNEDRKKLLSLVQRIIVKKSG